MDLSKYNNVNLETDGKVSLEPKRYVLHYYGEKEGLISKTNPNWEGYSIKFEVADTGQTVDAMFHMQHQKESVVTNSLKSLLAMCKAMGLQELPDDTQSAFMGKSVTALIKQKQDSIYFEVDHEWGETWKPANEKKKTVIEKPIEASPSAADLEKMGSTTIDDDEDAPF